MADHTAGCGAGTYPIEGASGYLVFDVDAAVELAARIPAAWHGGVIEVRPVTAYW